jgi:rhodanese-related sulfurtransferase
MRRAGDPSGVRPLVNTTSVKVSNPCTGIRKARAVWLLCEVACLLILVPALALGDGFQTPAITAQALAAREKTPDAPLVVDVRPNGEYKSGHVAGAVNIPYDKMDKHLDELSQAKHGVVLYCTQGHRTKQAEQTLLDNDVPNVSHLEGGLGAWRQGGYPIHTGWGP